MAPIGESRTCLGRDAEKYQRFSAALEHDAEECARFSDDIMLQLFNVEQDDFRPTGPKIILF
ncbi:hypothetical protein B5K08_20925 [Rhizobium leguminosarum bv. trifolii]|uniref:Uncharacterized protein n=1 Tax=Rhizobium leguminosarum bv. trifolii TaxID=386 RepID=A0A3E1B8I4_RHILT|nr:hypothetical protein B5K08_20925 [Rhizobium leguminosarum bv. trifolii]RFB88001.1 hypothetical protein B5K10_20920 [Rhizobium leguminosarum bv. trifolii]